MPSVDFGALSRTVAAGVPDVRACVIFTRDGLLLGGHPGGEERIWSAVAALGDVRRGFIATAEDTWAFCRRGQYGALAVAGKGAPAGLLLDRVEQMLAVAATKADVAAHDEQGDGVDAAEGSGEADGAEPRRRPYPSWDVDAAILAREFAALLPPTDKETRSK
jgi:hypothetical protein